MPLRLGYMVPEFPGQTHVFFWREIEALQKLDVEVSLLSTRKPSPITCRHDFVVDAISRTHYLFPPSIGRQALWACRGFRGLQPMLGYLTSLKSSSIKDRIRHLALLISAVDLLKWSLQNRIDHIHGHSCADTAHILAMVRLAGGPPYSLTLHGDLVNYGTDHQLKMENAEFIAVVGSHLKEQILKETSITPDKILVTCMGVNVSELSSVAKERNWRAGSLRLITIARLHPAKGHLVALLAVQKATQAGLNIHYTVGGDGPFEPIIRAKIEELGLEKVVTLTGTLSEKEVFALLGHADAFLLSSIGSGEAWPVSVMEAMGTGLPVIASTIGATPEMIKNGVDGFLVPKGDSDAIYSLITLLAGDIDTRRRVGVAASETARKRFDVSKTAGALYAAISDLQSKSPSGKLLSLGNRL
jgi:colanic acid/amylovoran biosynthesis glycosyltransferase